MKTKGYTDIKQSKKLAKILPKESADMYYYCGDEVRIGGYKAMDDDLDIPCWSLAALLDVLPLTITIDKSNEFYMLCVHKKVAGYYNRENNGNDLIICAGDCAIDAVYDLIIGSKKLKLL